MHFDSAVIENLYYIQVLIQVLWILKHIYYNFVVLLLRGKIHQMTHESEGL